MISFLQYYVPASERSHSHDRSGCGSKAVALRSFAESHSFTILPNTFPIGLRSGERAGQNSLMITGGLQATAPPPGSCV